MSLLNMCYSISFPFKKKSTNYLEVFNEACIFCILHLALAYTALNNQEFDKEAG